MRTVPGGGGRGSIPIGASLATVVILGAGLLVISRTREDVAPAAT
jgi:hypothetical protein